MDEAAAKGDLFVTATGNIRVIGREHFASMKDGAMMANSGHFDVEIDKGALAESSVSRAIAREDVEEFRMADGRRLYLLGEGRLVNLACAEGHPAEVMDMSFANQALCLEWLATKRPDLGRKVVSVPREIDDGVALLKLQTMGIRIGKMTDEQARYIRSWKTGT
jgi:adenosylhomocysteinase